MRLAAVWIPDWPAAAAVAEGLAPVLDPVAVADSRGIVAASAAARAAGVRRGMRRRQAQQLCSDLVLVTADLQRDLRVFESVVQAVEEVVATPTVMRPGLILFPAHGPARHMGGEDHLIAELIGAVARGSGAEAQVGVAAGLLAAILAARAQQVVTDANTARFVASYPIESLALTAATRQLRAELDDLAGVLRLLGIITVGHLAELPAATVADRFGVVGRHAHEIARGSDTWSISSRWRSGTIQVSRELDPPAERSDAAAFAARGVAEELVARVGRLACTQLVVTARTADGTELTRTWMVDGVLSAADVTDRVRWQLDGWLSGRSGVRPAAALTHLLLTALHTDGAAHPVLWGGTKDELAAHRAALRVTGYGAQVLHPVLQGGRTPRERVRLVDWHDSATPLRPVAAPWPGSLPEPFPSTVLDQPVKVSVHDHAGKPVVVNSRGLMSAPPVVVVTPGPIPEAGRYSVTDWAGPWPVSERWWGNSQRAAWLQLIVENAYPLLLSSAINVWRVEGIYD